MNSDCAYCPSSVFYYDYAENDPTKAERHELFHRPCHQCCQSNPQEEQACPTCRHLRLRHLILCVPVEIRKRFLFHLQPSLFKKDAAPTCPLCRLVRHMAFHAFGDDQIPDMPSEYSVCLYLGSLRKHFSGTGADIYLQFKVGDGMSNMWVGDLHIDASESMAKSPRAVDAMVHWPRLKEKIERCCRDHTECQENVRRSLPRGFRVINIPQRRIVEANNVAFAALSYVWGKDTRASLLTATRASIAEMKREGGLSISGMPRTIEDAMSVCNHLGIDYLWADRLCIVQDDPDDKMYQIMAMDGIYSCALLVLVAAHGDSMDFGIDGVSRARPIIQRHETMTGLQLTNLVRESEGNPFTLWHTRGWTYQEAVCARRLLHFTNTRTYFECQTSIFYEDAYNPEAELDEFSAYCLRLKDEIMDFQAFARHLTNYSSRILSYPADTYNALIGIANMLYTTNYTESFIYGVPKVDFDRALRWYAWDGGKAAERLETPEIVFPTWSWASAMVQREEVRYQDTDFYGKLAVWYTRVVASPSKAEQLEAINMQAETRVDEDWEICMTLASEEGCFSNAPVPWSSKSYTFLGTRNKFHARWSSYHAFCIDAFLSSEASQRFEDKDVSMKDLKGGRILAVAQIAFFRLKDRRYGLEILDSEYNIIGELCGDVTKMREEYLSPEHDRNTLCEFVAISLSGLYIRPYTGKERETKNYSDATDVSLLTLPIVNLLMIGRREKYAYRKELGWVYLRDWAKANRKWKRIILE
ncbi:HET-domain-containing protein [Lentithecium fluviatile CBS 122367]|uniref:HET-domain-containing protein n=1 Tax=Lentithecium fluviatile CBS 122367 TaxID=1168545 RepID=A0A6G1IID1_9PLEO|nr:HET-domain-containing protein [Lentithecium fluviatile CBS 122367]